MNTVNYNHCSANWFQLGAFKFVYAHDGVTGIITAEYSKDSDGNATVQWREGTHAPFGASKRLTIPGDAAIRLIPDNS